MEHEFYYLHEAAEPAPTSVEGFKYLCYKQGGIKGYIHLPFDDSGFFHAHKSTGKFERYEVDDNEIGIVGNLNTYRVKFKKVYDIVGFTVWKNELF